MKFRLEVNMDNAAFEEDAIYELRNILDQVWDEIENSNNGVVLDSNGNTVGEFEIYEN